MKILVVDDDPHMLMVTSAVLASGGYEVIEASTGKDALKAVARTLPDLVVLDVVLPDMSGLEVCRQIKADPAVRGTLVALQSGLSTSSEAQTTGLDIGADGYIVKGIPNSELLARVKSLVRIKQTEDALRQAHDELEQRVKERTAEVSAANQRLIASEKALVGRLRFEELLSELSARFVNILPERVDAEIEHGLKQVLEFFKVDRAGLIRVATDENTWQITHAALMDNARSVPLRVDLLTSLFPYTYDRLVNKRQVHLFSKIDDFPAEATVDRQNIVEWGVRSGLYIPIFTGGPAVHVISIDSVRSEHFWPEEYIPRLRLLGEILINALERKRIRMELEERLRFEALIASLSARFVNLPPEKIESEISTGLRSACEFFNVDRCSIGLFSAEGAQLVRVFEYHAAEAEPAPESVSKEQMPWYFEQLLQDNPVVMNRVEDLPPEAEKERRLCLVKGMKSLLAVPLKSGGVTMASCALVSVHAERAWPQVLVQRFRALGQVFANALARKQMQQQLQESYQEIEELKKRLEKENVFLRKEVKVLSTSNEIVGECRATKQVLAVADKVAPTDSTVLILGETGTGKELIARYIHNLSKRKERPLVTVNCGSLPPSLIENEIFGREKGAYTGALTRMTGRFEAADGSTLFLDEIAELPYEVQSKLLRVLEEGKFERLGSAKTIRADVRLIAATNRDLSAEVAAGRFRSDLYYRLNVFPVRVPPLRQRLEDIPALVWAFVREFEKKLGKRIDSISKRSIESLQHYMWPGNVRELKNVVEHAMIVCEGKILIPVAPAMAPQTEEKEESSATLQDIERRHIITVLERAGWRLAGKNGAAELLGMKRTTLQAKMRALGVTRPST